VHSPELKSYRFDAQALATETGAHDVPVTQSNERDASQADGGRNE
jgi:hypothetical protein